MATLKQKFDLLRGLIDGGKAFTGPFHAMVDVTRRCNLSCLGCRYHSPGPNRPAPGDHEVTDLSPDIFNGLCRDLRSLGTRVLFFLGDGEPFMHPGLFGMISSARDTGFRVTVITNGTLLTEKNIESIMDSGLDGLQVSLWAASEEDYGRHYPGTDPAVFHRVVEGLERLRSAKRESGSVLPRVTLHNPISRLNFRKAEKMVDLALETGCDKISFSPFLTNQGRVSEYSLTPEEERELKENLHSMMARLEELPLEHNIRNTLIRYDAVPKRGGDLYCYQGWTHTRVRTDGLVTPCGPCSTVVGDLKEKTFREIWNGEAYRRFRRSITASGGRASDGDDCDCEHCCYAEDSLRVHRIFTRLLPWRVPRDHLTKGASPE